MLPVFDQDANFLGQMDIVINEDHVHKLKSVVFPVRMGNGTFGQFEMTIDYMVDSVKGQCYLSLTADRAHLEFLLECNKFYPEFT
jgi:hypothetical protein